MFVSVNPLQANIWTKESINIIFNGYGFPTRKLLLV